MSAKQTANQYLLYCAQVIKADPNISEQTIKIMFIEYGKLLLAENRTTPHR